MSKSVYQYTCVFLVSYFDIVLFQHLLYNNSIQQIDHKPPKYVTKTVNSNEDFFQ